MRSEPSDRTDTSRDLALGQMPVAHQPLAAVVSQLVGMAGEQDCHLGLHRLRQQRSRAVCAESRSGGPQKFLAGRAGKR
jgi:hypothetical protein